MAEQTSSKSFKIKTPYFLPQMLNEAPKQDGTNKIIPFLGKTEAGHNYLYALEQLCYASGAYNVAQQDISNYAFSDISFAPQSPGSLAIENIGSYDVAQQIDLAFQMDAIGLGIDTIIEASTAINYLLPQGNAWLKVIESMDTIMLEIISGYNMAYHANIPGIVRHIRDWSNTSEYPILDYPVSWIGSPAINWVEQEDGSRATMIHIYTNRVSGMYGRGSMMAVKDDLYSDIQISINNTKVVSTELVAKHIIMMRGENMATKMQRQTENARRAKDKDNKQPQMADPFDSFIKSLREISTTDGESPSSIALVEYPGEDAPQMMSLGINRDTAFQNYVAASSTRRIMGALKWSPVLSGLEEVRGGLGSNTFQNLLYAHVPRAIRPAQKQSERLFNWLFQMLGFDFGISWKPVDANMVTETTVNEGGDNE